MDLQNPETISGTVDIPRTFQHARVPYLFHAGQVVPANRMEPGGDRARHHTRRENAAEEAVAGRRVADRAAIPAQCGDEKSGMNITNGTVRMNVFAVEPGWLELSGTAKLVKPMITARNPDKVTAVITDAIISTTLRSCRRSNMP